MTSLLAVAGMRAFADTLLHGNAKATEAYGGCAPTLGQLLGNEPHDGSPEVSRLPLRN